MSQKLNVEYLKKALLTFEDKTTGEKDKWTVDDATKGISILGAVGSGKTSASGRALALKYLSEGWGGIVLTVKPDETQLWLDYCKEEGVNRLQDVILFSEDAIRNGQTMVFNPLDYEIKRQGAGKGDTQNIINIFMNIYRMGNRIAQEGDISKEERFWDSALKRCIGKTIELLKLADQPLSMENIYNILLSCASKDENGSVLTDYTKSLCKLIVDEKANEDIFKKYATATYYCPTCVAMAEKRLRKTLKATLSEAEYKFQDRLFNQVKDYFFQFLSSMSEKTKSTIIEMFMGLSEPFLSGILNKHFAGETNLLPEEAFKGKIIIIDFPVKKYLDVGIIAQCVFKLMFQQAVERRDVGVTTKPVFLWADEAHMFVNPYDQLFLTTARSAMCSTVYLTQSLSNYYAVMGSGSDSKSKVDSLLGNLTTKIFHSNADAETNEYASRLIGQAIQYLNTQTASSPIYDIEIQTSEASTAHYLPQVQPRAFTTFATGGEENNRKVQALVFVMGKRWATNKNRNYLLTTFTQKQL